VKILANFFHISGWKLPEVKTNQVISLDPSSIVQSISTDTKHQSPSKSFTVQFIHRPLISYKASVKGSHRPSSHRPLINPTPSLPVGISQFVCRTPFTFGCDFSVLLVALYFHRSRSLLPSLLQFVHLTPPRHSPSHIRFVRWTFCRTLFLLPFIHCFCLHHSSASRLIPHCSELLIWYISV